MAAIKSLTESDVDRQNILNNSYAIEQVQAATGFKGVIIDGQYRFTKKEVAEFFEVDERTVE